MTFDSDIITIYTALTHEYFGILNIDEDATALINSLFTTDKVVRVLTVDLPKYDGYLLDYLEGRIDEWKFVSLANSFPFNRLLDKVISEDPVAIEAYRQLSLIGKKLQAPCEHEKEQLMVDRLYWTDRSLPWTLPETPILRLGRELIRSVLGDINPGVFSRVTPGSGASADRVPVPLRYEPSSMVLTSRLGNWFGLPGHDSVEYISRVLTVPKDARGPRVICCEPAGLMACQKSVQLYLHDLFNEHRLTRGRVNVLDQGINQRLAHSGSMNRSVATLDMAEASDRVSIALVKALFPADWFDLLMSLRSRSYIVEDNPRYQRVTMRKFAPMGSALCFPVETLCFWAVASAATARKLGVNVMRASSLVTVHGDDTIVPSSCYEDVAEALEAVSLKVNLGKSFVKGFFRESCGGDFFMGHDVTPCRVNNLWSSAESRFVELMNLRNIFYVKGLWATAKRLEMMLPSSYTSSAISPLPSTRQTLVPAFVGGYVDQISKGRQVFTISTLGVKKFKHSKRPTDVGRYIQYWTSEREYEAKPYLYSNWTGSYDQTIAFKKGKVKVVKTQTGYARPRKKVYSNVLVDVTLNNSVYGLLVKHRCASKHKLPMQY